MQLEVPVNPNDAEWSLGVRFSFGEVIQTLTLLPGLDDVRIPVASSDHTLQQTLEMNFGPGFRSTEGGDAREFRARLLALRRERSQYPAIL